jgi:hypothetical protein
MKLLLALICCAIVGITYAQDCSSHALMRKGSRLEYAVYAQGPNGIFKMARIVFEVVHVMDSAGSRYSTILKKGIAINDTSDHYVMQIVLQCDGKNMLFPADFFAADTVYLCDIYPTVKKRGYYSALTPLKHPVKIIPLKLEGVTKLPLGVQQVEQKSTIRYFVFTDIREEQKQEEELGTMEWKNSCKITSIQIEGKKTITTPAGSFACYLIGTETEEKEIKEEEDEEDEESNPKVSKVIMYYNSQVGLVKRESVPLKNDSKKSGYLELVGVK